MVYSVATSYITEDFGDIWVPVSSSPEADLTEQKTGKAHPQSLLIQCDLVELPLGLEKEPTRSRL